jgi:hypothetical protein
MSEFDVFWCLGILALSVVAGLLLIVAREVLRLGRRRP